MTQCVFCEIIANRVPSKKIAETEDILVVEDIAPKAEIHYLIIPKKHMSDVRELQKGDNVLASNMLFMAQDLSRGLVEPQDFRLQVNNGKQAGQCVFHLHMHFLAGKRIPAF